jgi:hypothetical protein
MAFAPPGQDANPCGGDEKVTLKPITALVNQQFGSEEIGNFGICHGQTITQMGGWADWGDQTGKSSDILFGVRGDANARVWGAHTWHTTGPKLIYVLAAADCAPPRGREYSCGYGNATVYNSSPIASFTVNPDTSATPINSGTLAKGTINLRFASPETIGTLVYIRSSKSNLTAGLVAFVIIDKAGGRSTTFDIPIAKTSTATSVDITVSSGGTPVTQTINIVP